MNVLLDTSAYSALLRGDQIVLDILRRSETIAIPAMVLGELYSGFRAGTRWDENMAQLTRFQNQPSARTLNITKETAVRYAETDVYLRKQDVPFLATTFGSQLRRWSTLWKWLHSTNVFPRFRSC